MVPGPFHFNKLVYETADVKIPDFREKLNWNFEEKNCVIASAIHHHKLAKTCCFFNPCVIYQ
jgi:hypothetical protein